MGEPHVLSNDMTAPVGGTLSAGNVCYGRETDVDSWKLLAEFRTLILQSSCHII